MMRRKIVVGSIYRTRNGLWARCRDDNYDRGIRPGFRYILTLFRDKDCLDIIDDGCLYNEEGKRWTGDTSYSLILIVDNLYTDDD
jgi:hypothetical protein